MIPVGVMAWLGTLVGRLVVGSVIIAALVGLRVADKSNQRTIGAIKVTEKIEKANDNAVTIGKAAAAKSLRNEPVGRLRKRPGVDPSTRYD